MRLTLALLMSLASAPALAHEFELLLLAPPDASEATLAEMRAAFLIASHERDSHPEETSEGHLGGMDVQLTLAPVDNSEAATDLAFVIAPLAAPGDAAVAALAEPGGAVVVDSGHLAAMTESPDPVDPSLPPFAERFRSETGRDPGPEATATYLGALIVERAVRPFGSVDDREALRRTLPRP